MKRRNFNLFASASMVALKFGYANAQAAPDGALLKTTLTPMGAQRAGMPTAVYQRGQVDTLKFLPAGSLANSCLSSSQTSSLSWS